MRYFLMAICFPLWLSAQSTDDPIEVILLGSFHFGATSDANSTPFPDLFSARRQAELDTLAARIAQASPDRIFIERIAERQAEFDSLFHLFRVGQLVDTTVIRGEEIQIGFRIAREADLPGVVCADVKQELPYDRIQAFETEHADAEAPPFFSGPYPFTDTSRTIRLADMALTGYYVALNDPYHRKRILYDYLHYAMAYVDGDDFTGPQFTAALYERNLKIFARMLAAIEPGDRRIVVLFGSSHTAFLRQFFVDHPAFRVLELAPILKAS
ncbi:DUF5694 domain-containing protein [Lewinella sp. IMCC34191]|uniref:DUF5694 domain-containing protein n=1 Tax=Lewinella sp. IMCC34191 TaxID=2259172 RepID=UPI000E231475|nr:DUF5694 domain-containing protein [Lewinella sp. IMCC34191]